MRPALAILGVALAAGPAVAQSPRAGGPSPQDDPVRRYAAELAVGGNLARGFVDRDLVSARGIIEASWGPWGVYTQPYWLYGRVGTPMGKITTDNEVYDRTGLFRRIRGPWFAYAVNAYDRSLRRKIAHRDLIGGGAGVTVWKCGPSSLLTSVGTLYEVADYRDAEDLRHTARFSVRLYGRYRFADGRLALIHDLIAIPSYRDPADDYRILFYGAVDAPIAHGFSFRVQADATQEGFIAAGTKHGDLAVSFGVAYKNEWRPGG